MPNQTILITGGTGFLGSALTHKLLQAQYDVVVLSRSVEKVRHTFGDRVQALARIEDLPKASQFKAVVNLAGAGILDQRWSDARKQVLRDSRIKLTEKLVQWMKDADNPPEVLISGSAIGFYGDQGDETLTEQSPPKPDFAQQLCADWEASALKAESAGVRVCLIRTGLVLGKGGGMLQRMLLPFRLGLGGAIGCGKQWMSWVHIEDWIGIVLAMIEHPSMRGPYNATAPGPVTNREFSATLAAVLKRPMLLPMPATVLKLLLGEMAVLVLGSQRVIPERLLADNFQFKYTELETALRKLLVPSR